MSWSQSLLHQGVARGRHQGRAAAGFRVQGLNPFFIRELPGDNHDVALGVHTHTRLNPFFIRELPGGSPHCGGTGQR